MYSESEKDFDFIPSWVQNLITLGYRWKFSSNNSKRRIAIISMPCDSHAAALVALGALRRDLEDPDANNIQGHFQYLLNTRNNLTNEEINTYLVIDELGKKWKFTNDRNTNFIELIQASYSEYVKKKGKQVPNPNGPVTRKIYPSKANNFHLNTDSAIELTSDGKNLIREDYEMTLGCHGKILEENLARSFSGILFVGKAKGKDSDYVQNLYNIHFYNNKDVVTLGSLLTLHHNQVKPISRLKFCNLANLKNQSQGHYLVIADGVNAFCDSLQFFTHSDLIGICSRDTAQESTENLLNELEKKRRYFTDSNNSALTELSSKSISIRILEKR